MLFPIFQAGPPALPNGNWQYRQALDDGSSPVPFLPLYLLNGPP